MTAARNRSAVLLKFRRQIRDLDGDEQQAARALDVLYLKGTHFAHELLGGRAPFRLLRDFCEQALEPWRGWRNEPALLEMEAPDDLFLPIELLPLAGRRTDQEGLDYLALELSARAFLGFAAVVRRIRRASVDQDTLLRMYPSSPQSHPRLPISFFRDATLDGARWEREFFVQERRLDLQVEWPEGELNSSAFARTLSRRLLDPRWVSQNVRSSVPDQIQHFSCHCITSEDSSEWYLRLSTDGGSSVKIQLDALEAELADLADAVESLPLVVLNACGSSSIDPHSAVSFLKIFLDNGNRGFVGTETRVPDQFAARFSRRFYLELLRGAPLGTALHHARWSLLMNRGNPLGILYVLYANPDLHVKEIADQRSAP